MSNDHQHLADALDVLRHQMDNMRDAKKRANIILRHKIDEYEQELEITIELIEEHFLDDVMPVECIQ